MDPVVSFKTSFIGSCVLPNEMLTGSSTSISASIAGEKGARWATRPASGSEAGWLWRASAATMAEDAEAAPEELPESIDSSLGLNPKDRGASGPSLNVHRAEAQARRLGSGGRCQRTSGFWSVIDSRTCARLSAHWSSNEHAFFTVAITGRGFCSI